MKITKDDLVTQRPTWAEIDLDALHSNYLKLQQAAPQSGIIAVIKADGYGHGAVVIARELQQAGASFLGVATPAEAIHLRECNITAPILVLGGITPEQIPLLIDHDFIPAVYTRSVLDAIRDFGRKLGRSIAVHLKIDTGMGRLGFSPEEGAEIVKSAHTEIRIDGVFTHFACADISDDPETATQLERFQKWIREHGAAIPFIHAANSAAIFNYPESHFSLVRPGLLLYGITPASNIAGFHPILTLKSKIIFMQQLKRGATIGYGRTFRAERDSLIATLPIGYNDGLRRSLSNLLQVEVRGKLCKIAGTVSMDLCMVDVTDVADRVQLYDTVTLLGPKNTAWHWAELLNTIPYEITCLIGSRVPRVYYKNGQIYDIYNP